MDLLNDDKRLVGAKALLGNMPNSTFYRHIRNGVIPKQRYALAFFLGRRGH